MRASLSKLGLARVAVLVAAGLMASTAYAWDIMLKDWSVNGRPMTGCSWWAAMADYAPARTCATWKR